MKSITAGPLLRALTIAAVFAAAGASAETLEVVGSSSAKKRLFTAHEAGLKAVTGIEVKLVGANSGTGLIAVAEGRAPVTATSASLAETIEAARKDAEEKGKTFNAPPNLVYHEVAQDRIVTIVNRDNPVKSLGKSQLQDVFSGKATNWKALGGPDLPVKVITGTQGSGTRARLQQELLGGKDVAAGVTEMRTSADELKAVSLEKGGIGAIGEEVAASSTGARIVPGYTIARPLAFITLGAPSPAVKKMIDYLKASEAKKPAAR